MGEAEIPPPHPLLPTACRYAGPAVIRAGELALSFTYCGSWETGQNSRADRPAPRKWEVQVSQPEGVGESWPSHLPSVRCQGQKGDAFPLLDSCGSQESWPWGHEWEKWPCPTSCNIRESWPCPLLPPALHELAGAVLESLT